MPFSAEEPIHDAQQLHDALVEMQILSPFEQVGVCAAIRANQLQLLWACLAGQHLHLVAEALKANSTFIQHATGCGHARTSSATAASPRGKWRGIR